MNRKQIGKGGFSRVYDNGETVIVATVDVIKEAYYHLDGDLFPKVLDCNYIGDNIHLLKMNKYTKVTAPKRQLNKASYKLYKLLRRMMNNLYSHPKYSTFGYQAIYDELIKLQGEIEAINEYWFEEIEECLSWVSSYQAQYLKFELSPRNIATDEKGNIILLDVWFDGKLNGKVSRRGASHPIGTNIMHLCRHKPTEYLFSSEFCI
jgi:hypothetical protein